MSRIKFWNAVQSSMSLFQNGECLPLRRWSEPAQTIGFAACALLINLILGFLISPFGFTDPYDVPEHLIHNLGVLMALLTTSLLGPFVETVIGQWLPLLAARWLRKSPMIQILYAAVWFSIMHLRNGPANVIQAFGIGWVLASCFLFCRKESWIKAYRVTSLAHALHNFVVFLIFLCMPKSG